MTEKEKMTAGEWFDPQDAELTADRTRATRLRHRLNVVLCDHDEEYRRVMRELCPAMEGFIRAPFQCDYGYNVSAGAGTFINFGCVCIDLAPIRIGRRTLIGPNVQLLTAHHPFDAAERATQRECGRPITIGDDCWLGGGAIVCPGVTIGDGCIVGAGAVVTKDLPARSLAVGNPARTAETHLSSDSRTRSLFVDRRVRRMPAGGLRLRSAAAEKVDLRAVVSRPGMARTSSALHSAQ